MQTALLLIGALLQPPPTKTPTLFIRIGDNHESRLLKSELTRDWFRLRSYKPSHVFHAVALANERREIRANIQFVEVDRWSEHKTPAYKIGRYGRWGQFDRRAFEFTGRPVRTVRWVVDDYLTEPLEITYERHAYGDGEIYFSSSTKRNKRPKPPWEKLGQ
jgi:hypothetical protein